MEKYRCLCLYANLSSNALLICLFGSNNRKLVRQVVIYLFIEQKKLYGINYTLLIVNTKIRLFKYIENFTTKN